MLRSIQTTGICYREIVRKIIREKQIFIYLQKYFIGNKNTSVEVNLMIVITKVTGVFSM